LLPRYESRLAALAARALRRSVRLVLTRAQMYGLGHRPVSVEHVALGADADGTLQALTHDVIAATSSYEAFARKDTIWGAALYTCPHTRFEHRLARLDVS